jgi:TP901 family phage tail tape measure protein
VSFSAASAGQIEIAVVATDLTQGTLRAVEANLSAFEGRATSLLNRLGSMSAMAGGIVAIGAAFGVAAKQAATVEQNVANLNAALKATPQQLAAIRQTGLNLSQITQFTDAQILQMQRSLAKAGTPAGTLADQNFNQQILNLASATFAQPQQAAEAYVAATKTFRLGTNDAVQTTDILAQAVDSSVGSLSDFQAAFKQIGPVANAAGESLKDTATAVADLQNAGLRGDTGTAIKTLLTRIESPSKQAKAAIDELGLSFYNAGGQLKSFQEIADELRLKTTGLTDEQRNQSLTQIFGTRGVRVADIFAEEGGQGIRDAAQHMAEIGTAGEIAREKLDTLQGSAAKLGSSLNVLAVQGGQSILPFLRGATDGATGLANALSTLNRSTGNLGGQEAFGGLAIGGELLAARQLGTILQNRRDSSPATKAATEQEAFLLKEEQQWSLSRNRIEAIESEHQTKMAEIVASGQSRIAAAQISTPIGVTPQQATRAIQAETEAAVLAEQKAMQSAIARVQTRPLAGPNAPPSLSKISIPTPVVAEAVVDEAASAMSIRQKFSAWAGGLQSKAAGGLASLGLAGGALPGVGEIIMGVAILATVEQLVIEPINQSLVQHAIDSDPAIKNLRANVNLQIGAGDTGNFNVLPESSRIALEANQRDAEQQVLAAQKRVDALSANQSSGDILGNVINRVMPGLDQDNLDLQKKRLDEFKQLQQQYADAIKADDQAKQNAPGGFVGQETTEIQRLSQLISSGKLTADQAMQQFRLVTDTSDPYATSLSDISDAAQRAGVSQAQLNALLDYAKQLFPQLEQQTRDAAVSAADLAKANEKQAQSLRAIGVPEQAIQQAVYHKGTAQEESDSKEVVKYFQDIKTAADEAAKAADEFNKKLADAHAQSSQALTSLVQSNQQAMGSAANGINLSQGVDSLASAAEELNKVRENLAMLGQSNPALNRLADLANEFKKITDAEDAATTAYRGYLLALDETDKRKQLLDSTQQRLKSGVDEAAKRIQQGVGNAADQQLVAQYPQLMNMLQSQRSSLGSTSSQELLTVLQNFPNEVDLNNKTQQAISDLGPQSLVVAVKEGKNEIRDYLRQLERDGITVAVKTYNEPQPGNPGYGNSTDASGYNESPGNNPFDQNGYVRPRTISVTGGGPNGNGSIINVPYDPAMGVGQGGAGGLGYQSLSQQQYSQIVTRGPLANPTAYAQIVKAAQDANVDPRLLLATMQFENSYGTNISAGQLNANNLAGIKYIGQSGAYNSGVPADNGGTYAGFNSLPEFFAALARNMKDSPYDKAFAAGDYRGIAQTYVTGGGPGTPQQQQNISSRVDYFNSLESQYPGTAGGSSAASGGTVSSAANSLRDRIVKQALSQVNIDELVNQCEKFVEDTVQAITGVRGSGVTAPGGGNPQSAAQALHLAQSAGLTTKNPQPGDLVYYDTGGDGHVAIYIGNGQQVSTWDKGPQTGANRQIHTEPVGNGAIYVIAGGVGSAPSTMPTGYGPGTYNSTGGTSAVGNTGSSPQSAYDPAAAADFARKQQEARAAEQAQYSAATSSFGNILKGIDAQDVSASIQELNTLIPVMQKFAEAKIAATKYGGDASLLLPTDQIDAAKQGMLDAVNAAGLWAKALSDIRSKNGQISADMQQITQQIGGPLAANLNTQLTAMDNIAQATQRIKDLNASKDAMQASIAATQYQRQQEDFQRQVAQFHQQQADQAQDNALQDQRRQEDLAYTMTSRQFEDRSRTLQFDQQAGQTDLQNQLTDTQKRQQDTRYQRTSAEQLQSANVSGAPSLRAASTLASQLAAMHNRDLLQKDEDAKEIDAIQMKIRLQQRADTVASFDLETERINAQRAHEDRMRGFDDEANNIQRMRQQRDAAQQEEQFGIQQSRMEEDHKNQLAMDAIDKQIAAQQDIVTGQGDILKGAQSNLDLWTQVNGQIGDAANALLSATSQITNAASSAQHVADQAQYASQTEGLSTASGVPYNQFPAPGGFQPNYASGTNGMVTGWGVVGDNPSGAPTGYEEAIYGTYRVYSHGDSMRMGLLGGTKYAAGTGGGGAIVIPIRIDGGAIDEEAVIARVVSRLRPAIRQHNVNVKNTQTAAGLPRSIR